MSPVPGSDSEQSVVESLRSAHITPQKPLASSSKGKARARDRSPSPLEPDILDMSFSPSPPPSPSMGPLAGVPPFGPGSFGLPQSYTLTGPSTGHPGLPSHIPSGCYVRPPPSGPYPDLGVFPSRKSPSTRLRSVSQLPLNLLLRFFPPASASVSTLTRSRFSFRF